ncbi:crossover junction endodeoxyribonuclease RuvC [Candidatus Wolfebacteria bacterium RIFOXYD12_FULL_48_21]|uniref:Crossover junction endodeoxyribonuclease RuvC n=1 Tax=Candidatus Wolfebacteria bacterium RIFOXYD1_FULL_48_65 TaxID=1802561 RepID=A0A1F8E3A6_9BACT|nr:MAG: crossover junction endodeoxyribonuclease RuvC [Candidatus Wolfebacteria bacterium RIFOXYD12_FULL_48_21]OGM95343.1 MAG: crossover junction endodeoxyribonuclease RuvC [Candidatus Wolfebacteria bacterium RIFOXYD1_FULL_48_65]OGM95923.1 MAG: crossover junction endodeoxyribonuclease RuvC [Candidatus Wolfebacteria bacterium RIFOXYD2_FULL_48_11]
MKILGIDPGTTRIGYGLIESKGSTITLLDSGLLKIASADAHDRLVDLADAYTELLQREQPELIAFEKLFFSKNVTTGLAVAQARGVLLYLTAKARVPFLEFSPTEVKSQIAGHGSADKQAVATMVKRIVGAASIAGPDDVTDAIAIAIVAANHKKFM